jgi:RNA polymerase sigma-70 factor (ECF subfamily)
MDVDPLDVLLERLGRGDETAAERLVADYEPYLRALVRRSLPGPLRAKFDSIDVVQSVWVHALHALRAGAWQITDRGRLRALLVTVARRRLVSRYRHHRRALEREERGGDDLEALPAPRQARPSEVAEAGELWERMLALCPPEHHEILRLRRQGLLLADIAARTGMHEGSVRRVLRRLARELALEREPIAAESSFPEAPNQEGVSP